MGHKLPPPITSSRRRGTRRLLQGVTAGASNLLNYVTYYRMKERAGAVGRAGVNETIRRVRADLPDVRIHAIGHSFAAEW